MPLLKLVHILEATSGLFLSQTAQVLRRFTGVLKLQHSNGAPEIWIFTGGKKQISGDNSHFSSIS